MGFPVADRLTAIPYSPDMVDEVRHFDFGSESYHREMSHWLLSEVAVAMSYGTKVWLYGNVSGDIVGFGSLGETNWNFPDKKSPRVKVAIIPALGLRQEFWGCPKDADPGHRYSSQILDHLITLPTHLPSRPRAIGLFVYPANLAAVKLYERHHFQRFHNQSKRGESGDHYHGYVRDIS